MISPFSLLFLLPRPRSCRSLVSGLGQVLQNIDFPSLGSLLLSHALFSLPFSPPTISLLSPLAPSKSSASAYLLLLLMLLPPRPFFASRQAIGIANSGLS